MVQTRTGTGEHSEAQADSIAAQLAAIAAKLDTMDVLKADIAALKNKAKEKSGGGYGGQETGESSWSSHRFQRPHNKIEFPKFSDGDPRGWLLKADKYFRYYQIPEDDKIEVAAMHLEGDALDLYSWMSTDQPLLLWEDLVHAFNKNFGPAEFQNPNEFLCSIKQTGTVQEYRQ